MKDIPGEKASNLWNKALVAAVGAGGGFFGLKALAIELPISTTIMLRSIAEIAREQGESIGSIETKMACLEVLALGGKVESDVAEESSYYVMRSALAKAVTEATEYLSKGLIQKTFTPEAAPPINPGYNNDSGAFLYSDYREDSGSSSSRHRCSGRSHNQHHVYGSFPRYGQGPFYS